MSIEVLPWIEPVAAAAPLRERPWAFLALSDGSPQARWSYLAWEPEATVRLDPGGGDPFAALRGLTGADPLMSDVDEPPPFTGGGVGLLAYEAAGAFDRLDLPRATGWPDLFAARYARLLAFDHHRRRVLAIGGAVPPDPEAPEPGPPSEAFTPEAPPDAYEAAVAEVVARIGRGDLFQANIAQAWSGRLRRGADPFDLFTRLTEASPAPYAAWWRLPGAALVSQSPESFLSLEAEAGVRRVRARPIKGTRPRHPDPARDAALAEDLTKSDKDRAENLMIVDLMRNDLARVCRPGTVHVEALNALRTWPHVHHLESVVAGDLVDGVDAPAVLAAAFPPGSITGAPKVEAMKVIAELERPRGPWCGSLALLADGGAMEASVLIRTVGLLEDQEGWRWRTLAGAGITADSDPASERLETEAKIAAIRRALCGQQLEQVIESDRRGRR
ncbi:anthranilate synthase component I family protein [Brevundimonas sp. 2R-24]|uniref:Anthranilate synthase component I family protein n=1 Tax=Peiella sedimenti TaxID=3061083 RepID=A0ABT8SLF8_9CAUL|nr:anthranilate synthase component I family protein [Caulobacteraceae bacterium XZ-24]